MTHGLQVFSSTVTIADQGVDKKRLPFIYQWTPLICGWMWFKLSVCTSFTYVVGTLHIVGSQYENKLKNKLRQTKCVKVMSRFRVRVKQAVIMPRVTVSLQKRRAGAGPHKTMKVSQCLAVWSDENTVCVCVFLRSAMLCHWCSKVSL